MEVEDVTHLFTKGYFKDLLEFNKQIEISKFKKSAIIDTNYLIQINQKDLISLFFEQGYEKKISNPLKKQMATLFRSHVRKEIAIFFSNSIFREFIYISPDKVGLVHLYNKHLFRVGSNRQFEPFFLDLASLLNLAAKEKNRNARVDLLDTYSYIIANLAGIDYFITENGDLKGIFEYINDLRKSSHLDQVNEIKRIMNLNNDLFGIKEEDFPIKKILEHLFSSKIKLTLPINIKDITDSLTKVSEKADSVIALCEMLNEIEEYEKKLNQHHKEILIKAREIINTLCESIGLDKPQEQIDVAKLAINLIEKDALWKKPDELEKIHSCVFQVLEYVYEQMHEEYEEEYRDLGEYFSDMLSSLKIKCKCQCGHEFEAWVEYDGVVAKEEREMGAELYHLWQNEVKCQRCGEFLTIKIFLYEYPEGCLNYVDVESESGCEILNKDEIYSKLGIRPD